MTSQSKNKESNITPENVDYLLKKHPIQCHRCGHRTGNERLDGNCSKCGFSNEESFVQWIFEREGIENE